VTFELTNLSPSNRRERRALARAKRRGDAQELFPERIGMNDDEFEKFLRDGMARADAVQSALQVNVDRCDWCCKVLDDDDPQTRYSTMTPHRDGPPTWPTEEQQTLLEKYRKAGFDFMASSLLAGVGLVIECSACYAEEGS
jgi:hypothetical protein